MATTYIIKTHEIEDSFEWTDREIALSSENIATKCLIMFKKWWIKIGNTLKEKVINFKVEEKETGNLIAHFVVYRMEGDGLKFEDMTNTYNIQFSIIDEENGLTAHSYFGKENIPVEYIPEKRINISKEELIKAYECSEAYKALSASYRELSTTIRNFYKDCEGLKNGK